MTISVCDLASTRVVFGAGAVGRVAVEADDVGGSRILLLNSPSQAENTSRILELLGDRVVGRFDGARPHTPRPVTDQALKLTSACDADLVVAVGGGSVTGLSKAIAYSTGIDQLVVPTTYAGSEVTDVLGETVDGVKTTVSDPRILPETVIYDVDLTARLPVALSVTSSINAMAHAVEALYSPQANPLSDAMARDAITRIGGCLPALLEDPEDAHARAGLLQAAWFAGACLGAVGMGLHHKLCHVLGGAHDLPHSAMHTVLLPHVMAFNAHHAPAAMRDIADALGGHDAPGAVGNLVAQMDGPYSLADLGVDREDLPAVAAATAALTFPNPRPVAVGDVEDILLRAWRGVSPGGPVDRERRLTTEARASFDQTDDPRIRQLLTSLVQHLHDYAVDNDLTEREWMFGIEFLTRTGRICSDLRQEFVLLSDTLGLSSMVDLLTNSRNPDTTPSAVLGPFYTENPPTAAHGTNIAGSLPGVPLWTHVRVQDLDGTPVSGATVDVWQADDDGFYDIQLADYQIPTLRARFCTDTDGSVRFTSIVPPEYPIPSDGPVGQMLAAVNRHPYRAPHIHFMIEAPGYTRLITQLFVRGGLYLDSDTVFGVKDRLIVDFAPGRGVAPDGTTPAGGWRQLDFTFTIAPGP